jgi:hypothetical protein
MLKIVAEESTGEELSSTLDEICREGARRMLAAALELEVDEYVAGFQGEVDERGRRLVVRNGHARARTITTVAGAVEVTAPRVNDKRVDLDTGARHGFKSSIVPPWCRKSPKVSEVLPLLYLHGLSSRDFAPALTEFFGSAAGLSPSVITRLTTQWQDEQRAFMNRPLADRDYVYVWVDGVHFNVRLEDTRLCCLVIVGVRLDGTKELVAIADGYRESTDSWADLLRDLKRRGMPAPWSPWATGRWASGRRCATCGPRPVSNGTGCTRSPTLLTRYPSRCSRRRRRCWLRSATPKTATTRWRPPSGSTPSSAPSGPRRPTRSAPTSTGCSRSTTSRPSIGCT